jgi:hypothetical protein
MCEQSLEKFERCITSVPHPIQLTGLDLEALNRAVKADRFMPSAAKISVGPTSVLESSQKMGGGTGMLAYLCSGYLLKQRYDLSDVNLGSRPLGRLVLESPLGEPQSRPRVVALSGPVKDRIPILRKALSIAREQNLSFSYKEGGHPISSAEDILHFCIQKCKYARTASRNLSNDS